MWAKYIDIQKILKVIIKYISKCQSISSLYDRAICDNYKSIKIAQNRFIININILTLLTLIIWII